MVATALPESGGAVWEWSDATTEKSKTRERKEREQHRHIEAF
jgi:hypothetical protein